MSPMMLKSIDSIPRSSLPNRRALAARTVPMCAPQAPGKKDKDPHD